MYEQPYNPYVKNLSAVKDCFKSPGTLILGIAQAIGAVLSMVCAILISTKMNDIIAYFKDYTFYILDEANISGVSRSDLAEFFNKIDSSSISSGSLSGISTVVISVLTAAAFFIIYFKSRNQNPAASPITGFTILYVFSIISLVVLIIAAVGISLAFGVLIWAYTVIANKSGVTADLSDIPVIQDLVKEYPEFRDMEAVTLIVVIIALLVVAVIALFFALFTAINRMRYYKSVRTSLSSVELTSKGAKPYGVMCVISAVFSGLSMFSCASLLYAPHLKGRSHPLVGIIIVSILSIAASVVSLIMEARLALGYKKYIDNVKFGYNIPSAASAPYSPFIVNGGYFNQQNPPQNNPYMPSAPVGGPDSAPNFNTGANLNGDSAASGETEVLKADMLDALFGKVVADQAPNSDTAPEPEPEDPENPADTPEIAEAPAPTCPLCGAEVDPDAPFCGNCGNRL